MLVKYYNLKCQTWQLPRIAATLSNQLGHSEKWKSDENLVWLRCHAKCKQTKSRAVLPTSDSLKIQLDLDQISTRLTIARCKLALQEYKNCNIFSEFHVDKRYSSACDYQASARILVTL